MRPFFAASIAVSFLFAAAAAPVLADTTGLVRGVTTFGGKPAANVSITLTGEGTTFHATSDATGSFVLPRVPFGRYTLVAHRAGSADISQPVEVSTNAIVNLSLEFQLKEIGRTQVVSAKGPGSAPVSVNSIGREQLAALPQNQSLNSVISTFPGIVQFSYNEPVAHGFHGLTYELDGVPLPQGTTSNFSEIVDPRTIDSLEVFTGAFPAEYGGSRQGAVVNILSHRANDLTAPESGTFTLGAGSYADAQASLTESVTLGNTRAFFSANEERTNRGIDAPTFDPVHDRSNESDQFLRTITNVGKYDTLAFDASSNVSAFEIPINTTANPNDPTIVPAATDDVQREYSRFANLVYTNNAASGTAYTQIAPWYKYDRIVYDGDIANELAGGGQGLRQDRRSEFEGIRITHFHTFGPNAVKLGLDASVENFSGTELIAYDTDANGNPIPVTTFSDNSSQKGSNFGAYVEDKWTPTKYISVLGGLRFDHSTGYVGGSQLQPRLEINGQVDPQDILHAYYGSLYAAPFLEDTRRSAVLASNPGEANAALPVYNLQPEHDQYYEFGLAHTFAQGARATLNFWKRDVRDVLDTTQLANTPIFAVFNNTIGIAKGVEGRVDARFANGDSLFFSTQLSSSQAGGISGSTFLFPPDTDPNDVTLGPEDHDQTFSATFNYTKRLGRDRAFFASLEPQYGTGYPVAFETLSGRLPPHLTFAASVGREAGRGANKSLGFDATFQNFTDSRYLIKIANGFNTTQWGPGFRADFRVTAPF